MQIAKDIIKLLDEDPTGWSQTTFCITHKGGISLWTANDQFWLHVFSPHNLNFTWWWKRKVWKAYCRWKNNVSLSQFLQKKD